MCTRDPWSGGAQGVDGRYNACKSGTWASHTRERNEASCRRPEGGGVWAAKAVKPPPQQRAQPRYANYWAPLTHKRHLP